MRTTQTQTTNMSEASSRLLLYLPTTKPRPSTPIQPQPNIHRHLEEQTLRISSPGISILKWTTGQTADHLTSLNLHQYRDNFIGEENSERNPRIGLTALVENEVVGEALVALKHEELKELGILSVGHRLKILKSVYDIKVRQDVPIDPDNYLPPCTLVGRFFDY